MVYLGQAFWDEVNILEYRSMLNKIGKYQNFFGVRYKPYCGHMYVNRDLPEGSPR